MWWQDVIALALGYLVGSIPWAYIVVRATKGADIRRLGSGNVGALNVSRNVGTRWGYAVGALDIGKGVATVFAARGLGLSEGWLMGAGAAAVIGHNWPIFLGFQGGKGMATTAGAAMSLRPLEFFIALAIAFVAYRITRNMAVFTGVLVLLMAAIVSATGGPAWMVGWLLGLLALSAARHLPATLKAWRISRSKGEGLLAFLRDRSPGQPSMGAGEG